MADSRRDWGTALAVAGLMLALFLVALDQTVVGTALPQIIADLSGGHEGDERQRAAYASKAVIRPVAAGGADKAR